MAPSNLPHAPYPQTTRHGDAERYAAYLSSSNRLKMVATILAYVIVLLLGYPATYVGMLASAPLAFILLFLPNKLRVVICGLAAGVAASLVSIIVARFIFTWLVGNGSFGPLPFVAAALSLVPPMWSDFRKYLQLRQSRMRLLATTSGELTVQIADATAPDVFVRSVALFGNIFGVALAAYWFLLRNAV